MEGEVHTSNMPKALTLNQFLEKSFEIHKEEYNYSFIEKYEKSSNKLRIIHNKCGNFFLQSANSHLRGKGCPHCFQIKRKTQEEFIKEAKDLYGDEYDYSNTMYINASTKVEIGCNSCGEVFKDHPGNHIHSKRKTFISRCPNCKDFSRNLTTEEFIEKAVALHADKYDYSEVEYIKTKIPVKIKCNSCGLKFEQKPNVHLRKRDNNLGGCPQCSFVNPSTESRGEKLIAKYLTDNNIEFVRQYTNKTCKHKSSNVLRFDFYIPSFNLLIEYDGLQHFKPIEFWGGVSAHKELKIKDSIKNKWAEDNKIHLVRFRYDCFSIEILNNVIQEFILKKVNNNGTNSRVLCQ